MNSLYAQQHLAMIQALNDLEEADAAGVYTHLAARAIIKAVIEDTDEDTPAGAIGAAVAEVIADYCCRAGMLDAPLSDWLREVFINQTLDQLDPTGNA